MTGGEVSGSRATRASVEQQLNLCQVFVALDSAGRVVGYATLSPIAVKVEEALLKKIGLADVPYRSVGGYLLGRMGVDKTARRKGIGGAVVARVARIAQEQRERTGGVFLAVDAKDEGLVTWYERLGFVPLAPAPTRRLVLPLADWP